MVSVKLMINCYVPAYKCACAPGYRLVEGKCSVASPAGAAPTLLLAHGAAIIRMDLQARNPHTLANVTSAAGLDYHFRRNLLFWSDLKTRKVSFFYAGSFFYAEISVQVQLKLLETDKTE